MNSAIIREYQKSIYDSLKEKGMFLELKYTSMTNWDYALYKACQNRQRYPNPRWDLICLWELIPFDSVSWSILYEVAYRNGYQELVTMIDQKWSVACQHQYQKRQYHPQGFVGACRGGQLNLVRTLLEDEESDQWLKPVRFAGGFYGACRGGHRETIDYLKSQLVKLNLEDDKVHIWLRGLRGACGGGHLEIVKELLAECYALVDKATLFLNYTTLKDMFSRACRGGNRILIEWLIEHYENRIPNLNHFGLEGACRAGHWDLFRLLLKREAGEPANYNNYDIYLRNACRGGHVEIAKLMMLSGATRLSLGMEEGCRSGHYEIVELMHTHGVPTCRNCWHSFEEHAITHRGIRKPDQGVLTRKYQIC